MCQYTITLENDVAEWLLSGIEKKKMVESIYLIRQDNMQKTINEIEVIYGNALLWMWSEWWLLPEYVQKALSAMY